MNLIATNSDWELADIYTDRGKSGTLTVKRNSFNHMIEDALNGKMNLIVTKPISRFVRITQDTLAIVRELKLYGVEVIYEKERIHTFSTESELFLAQFVSPRTRAGAFPAT